ncbi:hypothetical protein [Prosthecobacter sp.]|uniref:hypothetical protein n=1 Tax=Prosthecobacter sp. TaxID=1965333 RepID=UPI003783B2C0
MTNQKLLKAEREREKFANENLQAQKSHITKIAEAKKSREDLLATATKELETTKTSTVETAAKVTASEQKLAEIKDKLDKVSKIVTTNQKQIDEAGDIQALIAQIEAITKDRTEAEAMLANQTAHLVAAQERVKNLMDAAKTAEEREARGRKGIVDDDFTAKVAHSYTDWGFVVLNKGNGGGVFANADLEVKRGKDVVAKLKVRDVEQNSSVADLVKGSLAEGEHIRAGDLVVAAAEQSAKTASAKSPAGAAAPAAGAPGAAPAAPGAAPAMGADPFGAPAAPGAAPAAAPGAAPAMGSDPFGAPAAPAPAAPAAAPGAAPAMGSDPFGAPPATPPAGAPPAAGATPPSTVDPFGAAK